MISTSLVWNHFSFCLMTMIVTVTNHQDFQISPLHSFFDFFQCSNVFDELCANLPFLLKNYVCSHFLYIFQSNFCVMNFMIQLYLAQKVFSQFKIDQHFMIYYFQQFKFLISSYFVPLNRENSPSVKMCGRQNILMSYYCLYTFCQKQYLGQNFLIIHKFVPFFHLQLNLFDILCVLHQKTILFLFNLQLSENQICLILAYSHHRQ